MLCGPVRAVPAPAGPLGCAYRSASLADRQQVHRALAEATDSAVDPDREGYAASVPMLKRALTALRSQEFSAAERLERGLLTYYSAVDLCDDQSWYVLVGRNVELARE
jgi:hypothetical protein